MPSPHLRLFAAGVAAVAVLFCWLLMNREPEPLPRKTGKLPEGNGARDSVVPPWPEFGTPAFTERLRNPAEQWLDARGRSAAALVAIWDLTRNRDALREAAGNFPNDPLVSLAMIETCGGIDAQAVFWIEKHLAAEPKNTVGFFLKAWALEDAHDRKNALATLREAVRLGTPADNHFLARAEAAQKAAADLGVSPRETALLPLRMARGDTLTRNCLSGLDGLVRYEMSNAQAAGDNERVLETARLGVAIVNSFPGGYSRNLSADYWAYRMELAFLSRLPEETVLIPGGSTAGARVNLVRDSHQRASLFLSFVPDEPGLLRSVPEETAIAYGNRYLSDGEEAALTWLIKQATPAK